MMSIFASDDEDPGLEEEFYVVSVDENFLSNFAGESKEGWWLIFFFMVDSNILKDARCFWKKWVSEREASCADSYLMMLLLTVYMIVFDIKRMGEQLHTCNDQGHWQGCSFHRTVPETLFCIRFTAKKKKTLR